MNELDRKTNMAEGNDDKHSQRRRSLRLSSPAQATGDNKMAVVKRSIVVRKIAPRKTVAPSESNKENTPRRMRTEVILREKPKVSTPDAISGHGGFSSAKKKKAVMPSPILPSTPPPASRPPQPAVEPEDAVWSQKVRRSYSRLSEKSLNSPNSRETLFGFEKMNTPEVMKVVKRSKPGLEDTGSLCGLNSFTSLLEADDCAPELDTNIPGVAVVKEKRKKRKKVQQIDTKEMDALAAEMNAEFDEAEVFELVVE